MTRLPFVALAILTFTASSCAYSPTPPYVYSTPTREAPVTIEIVIPYRESKLISTPVLIPTPPPASADSITMLGYINESRLEHNLSLLTIDLTLTYLSQLRAEDLVDEYDISHETPTYGYLDEMLRGTGVDCCQVGENIGRTYSLSRGHEGLMESEGHRENILKGDFTSVGVGVVRGESRVIIVEIFSAAPDSSIDCTW